MRKDMFTPVAFVDNTVDDSYLVVSLFFFHQGLFCS